MVDLYYYASGKRVPLEPDEQVVAIDFARAPLPAADRRRLARGALRMRDQVRLVERRRLSPGLLAAVDEAGALHPVFRCAGAQIVVLPEVRVELETWNRSALLELIERESAIIERDAGELVTLRPSSGRGADALRFANRAWEQLHPRSSQARFLRAMPRPE